jgi:hypothetical protein
MAISNFSLVNQKLAFAKSLFTLTRERAPVFAEGAQQLQQDALLSSCALQLRLAFHFYLREIADRMAMKNSAAISSLEELESSLAQQDKTSSDVTELRDLVQQSESWLAQLLRWAQASQQSPRKEKEKKSFHSENLILAVDITAHEEQQVSVLTLAEIEHWLESFRVLVLRQRDISSEF